MAAQVPASCACAQCVPPRQVGSAPNQTGNLGQLLAGRRHCLQLSPSVWASGAVLNGGEALCVTGDKEGSEECSLELRA